MRMRAEAETLARGGRMEAARRTASRAFSSDSVRLSRRPKRRRNAVRFGPKRSPLQSRRFEQHGWNSAARGRVFPRVRIDHVCLSREVLSCHSRILVVTTTCKVRSSILKKFTDNRTRRQQGWFRMMKPSRIRQFPSNLVRCL